MPTDDRIRVTGVDLVLWGQNTEDKETYWVLPLRTEGGETVYLTYNKDVRELILKAVRGY